MVVTQAENDRCTKVGKGTPAGELLRRYWWPIAASAELATMDNPVKQVRLLGEDLVLYRDLDGRLGLVAEHCPHRGASLAYGFVLERGIRCPYHGWCFDETGACLEQPNELRFRPKFREAAMTAAYPVQELGGLIFGYLGPTPAPAVPHYELFADERGPNDLIDIGAAIVPCNWMQIMDNSVDTTHVEWLHGVYFDEILQRAGEAPTILSGHHVRLGFDRFEHGIIKRRLREGQSPDHDDWQKGHPSVFPGMLLIGLTNFRQYQIKVPLDDTHTWHIWYSWYKLSDEAAALLAQVKSRGSFFEVPCKNHQGRFVVDDIDSQDMMAWATQGAIADRGREHLGGSDRGVVMFRRLLEEQIRIVENGGEPMNVFRGPDAKRTIRFPAEDKMLGAGASRENELLGYLKTTHARYSPTVRELVALIEAGGERIEVHQG